MKPVIITLGLICFQFPLYGEAGGASLVKNGRTEACIIIAENPPRMVAMAALELQYYLEKISGARLPIVHNPEDAGQVQIYVGRSRGTDSLSITDRGLDYGAYRLVSGPDWLVLLGRDSDYTPVEPWGRIHADRPRARAEWDTLTLQLAGRKWGHPYANIFKRWWNPEDYDTFMSARYGAENRNIWDPRNLEWSMEYQGAGAGAGFWEKDEGGSLNAVYSFLRSLGARWYMPGETGEVVPRQSNILLPSLDETEYPDFAMRSYMWVMYSSFDDIIWARRMGMNAAYPVLGNMGYAHGLNHVHSRTPMKVSHPEYYALIEGVRDTSHRGHGTACYSSEGLVEETVKFGRFMFDHFEEPHISIWPGDGFKQCECSLCSGESPSDLVWRFVDNVARELYETHPDRLVSCGAYTPYIYPPEDVERFTPNVVVFIANSGRPGFNDTGRWDSYWNLVKDWERKVGAGNIMRVENNRYSLRYGDPVPFPVIHPHAMARDIQGLNGISRGECCEQSFNKGRWQTPGIDHLNLYVQARFLWDAGQDIDSLLEDYYTRFYGPAHEKMKAAFEHAESSYNCIIRDPKRNRCIVQDPREMDLQVRLRFLELLTEARDAAGETIYGERIQTILDELDPLEAYR